MSARTYRGARNLCVLLLLLFVGGLLYLPQTTKSQNYGGGPGTVGKTSRHLFVAASNACRWEKAAADYICDGTDDHVEINKALAKIEADTDADGNAYTGGVVELSTGFFRIGNNDDIAYQAFTADVVWGYDIDGDVTNGACVIDLSGDTPDLSDVAAQITAGNRPNVYVTGGDNGGETLEDNYAEGLFDIQEVNDTTDKIRITNGAYSTTGTYTDATVVIVPNSIKMKENCTLRGQGTYATILYLQDNENCTMVYWSPTTNIGFCKVESMFINGNKTTQDGEDGCVTGIYYGSGAYDCAIRDVFAANAYGSNCVIRGAWGFVVDGVSVFEWATQHSFVASGGSGRIIGIKANNQGGHALYMQGASNWEVAGGLYGGGDTADDCGICMAGASENKLVGVKTYQGGSLGYQDTAIGFFPRGNRVCSRNYFNAPHVMIYTNKEGIYFADSDCKYNILTDISVDYVSSTGVGTLMTDNGFANSYTYTDSRESEGGYPNKWCKNYLNGSGGTLTSYAPVRMSDDSDEVAAREVELVDRDNDECFVGIINDTSAADGASTKVCTEGLTDALVDGNITIGNLLRVGVDGDSDPCLEVAANGDIVVAIAKEANTDAADPNQRLVYVLPKPFTYIAP